MTFSKDLDKVKPPQPITSKRGKRVARSSERAKMLLEAAAIAYVQMMHGEYKRPGFKRQYDEDGNHTPCKYEVMRVAGYAEGSVNKFDEFLGPQEDFWKLVQLYNLRYSDPNFRVDREADLWREMGKNSLKAIYEQVTYFPHSLTLDQHLKVVNTVLNAGITMQKLGADTGNKSAALLKDLPEEKRTKIASDYKSRLLTELEEIEGLEMAIEAASEENL